MCYKLLYTTWYGSQRKIVVFDFRQGRIITFTMDEIYKQQLDPSLVQYINKIKKTINAGYWDYTAN